MRWAPNPATGRLAAAACLLCALCAGAQSTNSGLWIGDAELMAVSEANPAVADLSFDLGLEGRLLEETLIAFGDTWRFNDTGTALEVTWREKNFDDSGWASGAAEFGYGDGDEQTTVSYGGDLTNKHVTTYFRKSFAVAQPAKYSGLQLKLLRDDAAVVYLNGAPILRSNLSSFYTYSTLALSTIEDASEPDIVTLAVPADLLASNNVVAVEIHQASRSDPDISFDFELVATIAQSASTTLLPVQSAWKYDDTGLDLGSAWREAAYDDSGWAAGQAQLGYGDGDETTLIGFGPVTNKTKTTYFRTSFSLVDPSAYSHLDVLLLRDDGAAVYVNGQEVLRSNLPEGVPIAYDTEPVAPIGAQDESAYLSQRVRADMLVAGANVVAVEIHQHSGELGEETVGTTTWTPAHLPLRLILHVDADGNVRLLKQVIQMWEDGSYREVADGVEMDQPGRYVLISDDGLIPHYSGVGSRDGEMVGRRVSTVGIDFDGSSLAMTGTFAVGSCVVASNNVPADFRTNPFRHKYHPDHDNLDARYQAAAPEAPEIVRWIILSLSSRYPANPILAEETAPPGWGESILGGTYYEVLLGLHRNPINVWGTFELERVVPTPALNQ
ncbi:MAG: hypothetical protein JXR37_13915 [Kiritimatiellae bacterium]|nr:hypothetical protein [Kiritimatiellia bacterium]